MEWLIEVIRANPIQFVSVLISAVALGVAAGSLRTARQSIKTAKQSVETAKQSLETAQKALGATHLPNVGLDLRFEPHEKSGEKHLQFFFRNRGSVPAIDMIGKITVSLEGRKHSIQIKKKERAEPTESWSICFQKPFVKACLELAPKVFEAGHEETAVKLRLGVPAPRIGVGVELNWNSPAYGIGPVGLQQSWELESTSYSDDRLIRGWTYRPTADGARQGDIVESQSRTTRCS
jgi:hypothetical protein